MRTHDPIALTAGIVSAYVSTTPSGLRMCSAGSPPITERSAA